MRLAHARSDRSHRAGLDGVRRATAARDASNVPGRYGTGHSRNKIAHTWHIGRGRSRYPANVDTTRLSASVGYLRCCFRRRASPIAGTGAFSPARRTVIGITAAFRPL